MTWKKPVKLAITIDSFDPKNVEDTQDVNGNHGNSFIRVEMLSISLIAKIFEGSNIDELMQRMFAHVKTQVENLWMPKSGF